MQRSPQREDRDSTQLRRLVEQLAVGRLQRFDGVTDRVQDRKEQRAANLIALKEAPEGLARDAEPLGHALTAVFFFVIFEDDGGQIVKKLAGYHQFHAVRTAVRETLRAAETAVQESSGRYESGRRPGGDPGDRRIGVVWHTQGSGKSLTKACYAGAIIREPAMQNSTIVVLTDRNDLDE